MTLCLPIGAESKKNGSWRVKIAQPNVWRKKQYYLYEKYIGPVPKGYFVIFLDGNKENFDLANLHAVKQSVYSAAIKRGLLYDNAEATKSGLLLAEMMMNVNKRAKE